MSVNWLDRMTTDPTPWLLEHPDPMVRYRVLTWIQERPESDSEVRKARAEAAAHPRIEELLAKRERVAQWYNERLRDVEGVQIPYIAPTTTQLKKKNK